MWQLTVGFFLAWWMHSIRTSSPYQCHANILEVINNAIQFQRNTVNEKKIHIKMKTCTAKHLKEKLQ
jgi:hypothetical protein